MSKKAQNTEEVQDNLVSDPELATVTNDELLALHTAQNEVISDLQAKIALLEKEKTAAAKGGGGVVVTIEDVQYRVVHGLLTPNGRKSPAEIAADEDLCASLIADGSSAIQRV